MRMESSELEKLLAEVWPHAYRVAFSILHLRAAAEDAAQEACAIVIRSIEDLRSSEAFGVWFYRIVVREALRIERRTQRTEPLDVDVAAAEGALGGTLARLDILRALGRLSARQRAVVTLRYYADLNSREIGAVLAIPEGTVRFELSRARRSLERLLDDRHDVPSALERGARAF